MKSVRNVAVAFVIVLLLLVVVLFFSSRRSQQTYVTRMSSKTVIAQIRSLSRLETASFTIEKVIDAGTAGSGLKQFLFGDRILLIAHGEVIAGFDLVEMKDKDAVILDQKLTLHLPPPAILLTRLDSNETRVYDRRRGVLVRDNNDLESQARKEAENAITKAACDGNILIIASQNAKDQLTALFKSVGFSEVQITIPSATC